MKSGLLIINLGTPSEPSLISVKKFLREFLSDKRIINLPWVIRTFLVHGIIIPFRAKKSLQAYKMIWSPQGSPLLYHSLQLANQIKRELNGEIKVALGMRYGVPSIQAGLEELKECSKITILPLYPQYSSAASGSSIEKVINIIKSKEVIPSLNIIRDFYLHPAYINAQAEFIKMHFNFDSHLLFSYHGVPERQILKSGCFKRCVANCPTHAREFCYKSQCYQTSELLAKRLNLSEQQYSTAFQSRLGKTPWIKPYTDELLSTLAAQGVRNLTISCPSFVVDCLETLEEIGIRGQKRWSQLGGVQFSLIPSMNSWLDWARALINISTNSPK